MEAPSLLFWMMAEVFFGDKVELPAKKKLIGKR